MNSHPSTPNPVTDRHWQLEIEGPGGTLELLRALVRCNVPAIDLYRVQHELDRVTRYAKTNVHFVATEHRAHLLAAKLGKLVHVGDVRLRIATASPQRSATS